LAGHLDAGIVDSPRTVVDVPQNPDLALFCATVWHEIAFGLVEAGVTGERLHDKVADVAARVGVSQLMDRPPQALSRGQRLRVAVGAAISCDPGVLLLDEPTSGQDRQQVEQMMVALSADTSDRALVFVTHDIGLALSHATRVVVLHEGEVVADGPPAEALQSVLGRVPLRLPPLAQWCFDRGLSLRSPAELAAYLCGEPT
jgi:energy-coupling factor transport system ATP-binding protein